MAEVTRTDSLGIRIVAYPPLETVASPSTPSTTRELRIGGSDALEGQELEFLLGRPAIIGRRLYLTDFFVDAVRAFDLEGGEIRAFGSEGQGPGEFYYPAVVGLSGGDSVVVYDARLRRVTILDGAVRGSRIFTVPSEVGRYAGAVGVLAGGHLVFSGGLGLTLQGRERLVRDTIPIAVADMEGVVEATFGAVRTEGIYEAPPHGPADWTAKSVSPETSSCQHLPCSRRACSISRSYGAPVPDEPRKILVPSVKVMSLPLARVREWSLA